MKIVKHSGDIVDFNPVKLENSLLKSGASQLVVDVILKTIQKEIYEGISTKQIYKMAFSLDSSNTTGFIKSNYFCR